MILLSDRFLHLDHVLFFSSVFCVFSLALVVCVSVLAPNSTHQTLFQYRKANRQNRDNSEEGLIQQPSLFVSTRMFVLELVPTPRRLRRRSGARGSTQQDIAASTDPSRTGLGGTR